MKSDDQADLRKFRRGAGSSEMETRYRAYRDDSTAQRLRLMSPIVLVLGLLLMYADGTQGELATLRITIRLIFYALVSGVILVSFTLFRRRPVWIRPTAILALYICLIFSCGFQYVDLMGTPGNDMFQYVVLATLAVFLAGVGGWKVYALLYLVPLLIFYLLLDFQEIAPRDIWWPRLRSTLAFAVFAIPLSEYFERGRRGQFFATEMGRAYAQLRELDKLKNEVHDNIGNRIAAAIMQLREGGDSEAARRTLEGALSNARDLTSVLNSDQVSRQTWEQEIRGLASIYQGVLGFSMKVEFDPVLNDVPVRTRLNLTRVLLEWIGNSMRHGKAREFSLKCSAGPRAMTIRLISNGRAFRWDSRRPGSGPGNGLRSMAERLDALGGRGRSVSFSRTTDSAAIPPEGTLLVLRIPRNDVRV